MFHRIALPDYYDFNVIFITVYICKHFPPFTDFSLISAGQYEQEFASSHGNVASACALLAYTSAHQVENLYKNELQLLLHS